jgi:hypothetical protein
MHKLAAVTDRAAQICAALATFIFLISGIVYLYLGRWTVTHQDFWRIYDFCLNHTWLQSALLKDNGHSFFFPSFLWLTDLRFFHGEQLPLFLAGVVLLFLTVALLLIPVWRDETVGLTAKVTATLVVIVGNFWMARSQITASGGFNAICSLVTVSLGLAVLLLPKIGVNSAQARSVTLLVVCVGFVASFSFGTGLAIWPALLFLVWCLRLPRSAFVPIGVAAMAAIVIYERLPPHSADYEMFQALGSAGLAPIIELCRLVGSPFFYVAAGWHGKPFSADAAQSSLLSLWCGGVGLAIAIVAMVLAMLRRDLTQSSLKLVGVALVTFDFVAMTLIIAGRASQLRALPSGVAAPRYLFWSTLFWTGLLLIAIKCAQTKAWLRRLLYLVALGLPVLVFPEHYNYALNRRWATHLAQAGATSLVNGVRDDQQIRVLAPLGGGTKEVYHVAEQLRARRLDMFADGLQDWIGLEAANLFGKRYRREKLEGRCVVAAVVQNNDGATAARVVGQASKREGRIPKTLVIVDPTGVIRGVARSSSTSPLINRLFYLGKVQTDVFVGYIRDYNPQLRYTVRSADDQTLSREEIPVQVPATRPATP